MCGNCLVHEDDAAGEAAIELLPERGGPAFLLEDACPRARLIAAVAIAFVLASVSSLEAAALGLVFAVFLTMASGKPVLGLLKRLPLVNTFIIFMWFMLPFSFSTTGEVIFTIGPLEVTREGVIQLVNLKSIFVIQSPIGHSI